MKMETMRALAISGTLSAALLVFAAPAQADAGVKVGMLSCNVAGGWGFVFESTRDINCVYSPKAGVGYRYHGHISKYGVDIGYVNGGAMIWEVVAPTRDLSPGDLSGDYAGVTGGATVGVGLDANVLVGGSNKSISLQPLSIEGNEGINVAAGVAALRLKYQPGNAD